MCITKSNGKETFFQETIVNGKRKRRALTKSPEISAGLARKLYLQAELKLIEKDISALMILLKSWQALDADSIIKNVNYAKIPTEMFFGFREEDDWANQPFQQSTYNLWEKDKLTTRGLRVRSKSEVLIAEKLYQHDIPFRHEQILTIDELQFAPDFTIRLSDGELMYWEHCGLTNKVKYMKHHKWKMGVYEEARIVPWKNLIVTYDDELGGIDMSIIESEIRNKLEGGKL